eukprot:352901-Chlamydomonas_euryale.AAC.15
MPHYLSGEGSYERASCRTRKHVLYPLAQYGCKRSIGSNSHPCRTPALTQHKCPISPSPPHNRLRACVQIF